MSKKTHKHEENSIVSTDPSAALTIAAGQDYSQYAGQGFEDHTRDDYAVPFLGVLQSNSPQIETLPSARPGMLFNTVTNELYDFIACQTILYSVL